MEYLVRRGLHDSIDRANFHIGKVIWVRTCHIVKVTQANLSYGRSYEGKLVKK